mmetsp:Transcript_29493/g.47531  ORF Transcript_29493/g.47531 Transcript_29493/m.47531 type:complete len:167 (+) Transcript_29493:51-551(+)
MKIFCDIITKDNVLTDLYTIKEVHGGFIYEVDAKYISLKSENDFDIGANPSAEEAGEEFGESANMVIDLVNAHRLVQTSYDKKGYMILVKAYMGEIKKYVPEGDVDAFQKNAHAFVKEVLGNFNDYAHYTGESMSAEGMDILCKFADDGLSQKFYFWKNGLKEEKV